MNSDVALFWLQESLRLAVLVAAPLLGTALAVGLVISLIQAVTSIQGLIAYSTAKYRGGVIR